MDLGAIETWVSFVFEEIVGDSILLDIFSNKRKKPAKEKRYEFLLPLVSVLCSIIAVSLCNGIGELVDFVMYRILSSDFALLLQEAAQKLDFLGKWTSIAVFMLVYHLLRKKAVPRFLRLGKRSLEDGDSFWGMYVLQGNHGEYRLAERWRFVKRFIGLVIVFNCLFLIIVSIVTDEMSGSFFTFSFTKVQPVICLVFLAEVYNLLNCAEDGENEETRAEPEDMDLVKLLTDYQQYARKNEISCDITYREHLIELKEESWEFQRECRHLENYYVQYFMKYLGEKGKEGTFYSTQCLDTVVRLIERKNTFFATPFYKDFDICIFFPIFLSLLRRERALVLLEDNGKLEEFCQWLKTGIEEIQDLVDFWEVKVWDWDTQEADVGILSFQNIYQVDESNDLGRFLAEVSFAVVLEAADVLAGGQEVVAHLAERVGIKTGGCTWLLCDRNEESVLDLFSHLFGTEFAYVSATPLHAPHMVTAFWNLETEPVRIWEPIQRYLGIGAGILEVAGNNKIRQITWYGKEAIPLQDWKWIMGQYYQQYGERTGQMPQQVLFNHVISYEKSGAACQRKKEKFIIVEDVNFNLYEVERQYATRAEEKMMLHILSPNYMLRNFMRSREDVMKADAKYIARFVPEYVSSNRNVALKLIRHLLKRAVPEEEIEEIFHKSEEIYKKAPCIVKIREAVQMVLNIEDADIKVTYRNAYSEQHRSMKCEPCYQLVDNRVKKEFGKYFQQAKYLDESGQRRYVERLFLAGHLEQKYLPGQFVTLDGKYYEIKGFYVNEYEKILEVKRASEQIFKRNYYRQLRRYEIKKSNMDYNQESKLVFRRNVVEIYRCVMDIKAYTYGYMELDDWNDIMGGREICYKEGRELYRQYEGKQLLRVELPGTTENTQSGEMKKVTLVWLAVLLNEALCTLYPQYYHLVSIAIKQEAYRELMKSYGMDVKVLRTVLANIEEEDNDKNCFYILEDSREDMGLLRSLERNFQRIVNILQDYIEWSESSGNDYIKFGGE